MTDTLVPTGRGIGDTIKEAFYFDIAKAAKLPEGEVEVIVSTPTPDSDGERVNINGIDLSRMSTNAPVMWAHDYTIPPIGSILKLWKSSGQLKARVKFALGLNPMADMIYQMVKEGFIKAVSIGGLFIAAGKKPDGTTDYSVIDQMQMIELSFCPIGANPDALVTLKSVESDIVTVGEIHTWSAIAEMCKSIQTNVSALASSVEAARVSGDKQKEAKRVLAKSAAKQIDKQSELIIASINSLAPEVNNGRRNNRRNSN